MEIPISHELGLVPRCDGQTDRQNYDS